MRAWLRRKIHERQDRIDDKILRPALEERADIEGLTGKAREEFIAFGMSLARNERGR